MFGQGLPLGITGLIYSNFICIYVITELDLMNVIYIFV
jgi:hypothetical protein